MMPKITRVTADAVLIRANRFMAKATAIFWTIIWSRPILKGGARISGNVTGNKQKKGQWSEGTEELTTTRSSV